MHPARGSPMRGSPRVDSDSEPPPGRRNRSQTHDDSTGLHVDVSPAALVRTLSDSSGSGSGSNRSLLSTSSPHPASGGRSEQLTQTRTAAGDGKDASPRAPHGDSPSNRLQMKLLGEEGRSRSGSGSGSAGETAVRR
eukprot:COSAG04_NODE_12016_length_675_cov_1.215278_1_plen_136_part_10